VSNTSFIVVQGRTTALDSLRESCQLIPHS